MKRIILSFLIVILFNACSQNEFNCESKVCTTSLVSVNVKFLDVNGNPLVVNEYQSKNLRTGKLITGTNAIDNSFAKGIYVVASDGNLKELSSSDKILVSAKHPVSNVLKQAEFTISGGECACHVGKIAGSAEIRF